MASNTAWQEALSVRFRRLLSGAQDGNPPWLGAVASGEDEGLFRPTDAPWVVHRDFGTLVGGIRALLVQALHPGSLAGVRDHSRYEKDPLGRLAGTIRWLTVTTFAGHEAIRAEAFRVNRLHDRVNGEYRVNGGSQAPYSAKDQSLLLWVHVAFMESFLVAHELYTSTPIPAGALPSGADNYVAQWSRAVVPLGLRDVPMTRAAVDEYIDAQIRDGFLTSSDDTRRIIQFIRRPPLPALARPVYRLLFAAAVVSLRPEFRQMLGLKSPPRKITTILTRATLRIVRWAIGPDSPIEDAAIARLRRIGVMPPPEERISP
ncbi:MAG: hypothetical protein RLZZ40_746 [Actinomycetota bacterium]|jgi:uncharacterized protein (DUF2236 family)